MSEITFILVPADKEDDFNYIAARANVVNSVPRTDALDVEAVSSGEFYDEGEKIRIVKENLMTHDELSNFLRKNNKEVRFNDPEIREVRKVKRDR